MASRKKTDIPDVTPGAQKIGEALGSNPGGEYLLNGVHHYVKYASDPQHAASEVAASYVYNKVGVPTTNPHMVKLNGKYAVASKWQEGLKPMGFTAQERGYKQMSEHDKNQMGKHFVAAVLTKNWDAVGLHHDNIARAPTALGSYTDGKIVNADLGGAFGFRARGEHKPFGDDIDEFKSLRIPGRPSGEAFGHLQEHHINQAIKPLKNLDRDDMAAHFRSVGLANPEEHADAVYGRAQKLLRMI